MIRSFTNLTRFTCGTIGQPGDRTFYLQFQSGYQTISLSLEKSQVAALGERLLFMLKEIRLSHPLVPKPILNRDLLPLEMPLEDEFRIGSIAIFYDEGSSLIQIDLRELDLGDDQEIELSNFDDIDVIRLFISVDQARTFADRAELVVAAGRQPCPFCAFPIDPQGHLCARANGYRR